jgi:hypothetical protein
MTLAQAQMADSGLTGRFQVWFLALRLSSPTDTRNAKYHKRTKTTLYKSLYGRKQNLLKFRAFGCRAYLYLNKQCSPAGKHVPRALEGIHLGFATDNNTSGYFIYIPSTKKIFYLNQVRFNELLFPYHKHEMIDKYLEDEVTNSLRSTPS